MITIAAKACLLHIVIFCNVSGIFCNSLPYFRFEVSSSDDEGTLSVMEKLVKSFDKFTKLTLESLKAGSDTRQAGTVQSIMYRA